MQAARPADNAWVQHRYERISIETPRQRITGTATLAADGYRSRLSDLLNAPERDFIALVDVIVEPLEGESENAAVHDFIAVHRQHVVFVVSLGPVEQPNNHSLLGTS
ncbi:MAG: hypothetical protein M3401_13740 [Actinomycetota bacterium]|nr:hypothetical protein [Actinomycetota bacterium]